MSAYILIVEDEPAIATLIRFNLEAAGYRVATAERVSDAEKLLKNELPDLILMDYMLPDVSGVEYIQQLRGQIRTQNLPIIMLTARSEESDKELGLNIGADDYITKPFSPRELVARIRAMLRRPRVLQSVTARAELDVRPPRCFGALSIDVAAREVRIGDEQILLTRTEFDILEALSGRPGIVLTRRQLLEIVRDGPWVGNEHLVDVHIGHLRRKLGDVATRPRYIATVRGVGYRMGSGK